MSKDSAEPVSVWVSYVLLTYSTQLYVNAADKLTLY